MVVAGIESGGKNSKVVLMDGNVIFGKGINVTGFDRKSAYAKALERALQDAGISRDQIEFFAVTGCGQESVEDANYYVNDIKAMANAAMYFFPSARTVVDVGGVEGRTAKIDSSGRVVDFAINERCAAGAGAFIESMAKVLEVDPEQMGPMAMQSKQNIPINAQCAVFAESEAIGLLLAQTDKKDISKAVHDAMASRVASIIRQISINTDVVLLGGLGHNLGFIEPLRKELKIDRVLVPECPEYGPAVGAALAARRRT